VEQQLRVERVGGCVALAVEQLPPARDLLLDLLAPRAVLLAPQQRRSARSVSPRRRRG
jgi:hypothetical protein